MKKLVLTAALSLVGVIAVSAQQSTPLEKPQENTSPQASVLQEQSQSQPEIGEMKVKSTPELPQEVSTMPSTIEEKKVEPLKEDKKYEKLKKKESALLK
jgi:hypothetical protein